MTVTNSSHFAILRLKQTQIKIGLSRSTLYAKLNPSAENPSFDPSFPKPVSIGPRSIGFIESEIDAWIIARAEARQNQSKQNFSGREKK